MRWKCICSYKGTRFEGWQYQPTGFGIQNHIEEALSSVLDSKIRIQGCSRTDAGVHARGQCFHFDATWPHTSEKLIRAIHSKLDKDIRIESAQIVSNNFHARYKALRKRYSYKIYLGRAHPFEKDFVWARRDTPLNIMEMKHACRHFIGTHDFTAFSAVHAKDKDPNPIKSIQSLNLKQKGSLLTLSITGSGFLYKMVRSISGALYSVGRGRLNEQAILEILKSKKRDNKIVTAPACGLSLEKIYYR